MVPAVVFIELLGSWFLTAFIKVKAVSVAGVSRRRLQRIPGTLLPGVGTACLLSPRRAGATPVHLVRLRVREMEGACLVAESLWIAGSISPENKQGSSRFSC